MDEKIFSCLFSPFRTNAVLSTRGQKVLKKDPKPKQLTLDSSFANVPPTVAQPSQHPAPSPTPATDVQDKQVDNPTAQDVDVDENMDDTSGKDSTREVAQDAVDMDTDDVPPLPDNVDLNDAPGSSTDTSQDPFAKPPFTQRNPSVSTSDDDIPVSEWEPTQSPRRTLVPTQVDTETDGGMAVDDSDAAIRCNKPVLFSTSVMVRSPRTLHPTRVLDRDDPTGEAVESITKEIQHLDPFPADTLPSTTRRVIPAQKRVPSIVSRKSLFHPLSFSATCLDHPPHRSAPRAQDRKKRARINTAGESSKPPSLPPPPPPPPQSTSLAGPSSSSRPPALKTRQDNPRRTLRRQQPQRTSPPPPVDESEDADLLADSLNTC
ncbi:hypothetical protein JVT61DRAFT_1506 [Boletus reticuloceps]|uniref:Uncharacterized protein n=1 Tax=Boletus reticuloceps TaxID=495285 RepID=A0A8I2YC12_9AGAM|nr:hypothetical protein JVT61DRAFT_1506 [Boletus reticuloceps]